MRDLLQKLQIYVKNHFILTKNKIDKKKRIKYVEQHQLTSTTSKDRYPQIFKEATILADNNEKILSFGCSTGEECFSIRNYFSNSKIIGADINESNLRKAKAKNTDDNILFVTSTNDTLKDNGAYDIIFAMSVLCRWEDTKDIENCEAIYSFSKFKKTLQSLISLLKDNGLLIVYNANFKVEDAIDITQLNPIKMDTIKESGFVHKFNKVNLRDRSEHNIVFYRKVAL